MDVTIRHTDGTDAEFITLCKRLDQHLHNAAEDSAVQDIYDTFNGLDDIKDVFIASLAGEPVGCVSWKEFASGEAELKRMFVLPGHRGQGIASALLEAAEQDARAKGYQALLLETGKHLESARALYAKIGFTIIPNFGPYVTMPNSVCMRKELQPDK